MRQCEAILDIGTSKVVCLIGSRSTDNVFDIQGAGIEKHSGLRKGNILDEQDFVRAIKEAVTNAQGDAGRRIKRILVGVPGQFLSVYCARGQLTLDKRRPIEDEDIDRLIESSMEEMQTSGVHIHGVPVQFKVDGATVQDVPVGSSAREISAIISHVYMNAEFEAFIQGILNDIGIEPEAFVDTLYTQGLMLVSGRRRRGDSLVLDVGYYHMDLCLLRNEAVIYQRSLPVGGYHLSSDLTYVLDLTPEAAEAVKRSHVFALDYSGREDSYKLGSGISATYAYEDLQDILEARAEEIARLAVRLIEDAPVEILPGTPLYFCGGGLAMMRGSRDFLQPRLGLSILPDSQNRPKLNTSNYTSAFALLAYVSEGAGGSGEWKQSKLIKTLVDFFTK